MKNLILITIILISCNSKIEDKGDLKNSVWKRCGDDKIQNQLPDFIFFCQEIDRCLRNDSIYLQPNDSLMGVIQAVGYYYGERRLFVKDLKGNVERYCKQ